MTSSTSGEDFNFLNNYDCCDTSHSLNTGVCPYGLLLIWAAIGHDDELIKPLSCIIALPLPMNLKKKENRIALL